MSDETVNSIRTQRLLAEEGIVTKTVTFTANQGVQVRACVTEDDRSRGTVILLHGLRSCSAHMCARAALLHSRGFGVLIADLPKSKNRFYKYYTFGQRESLIVDACCRYIRGIRASRPVYLLGVSMGAVAILMSEQKWCANALVVESPYWSLKRVLRNGLIHHIGRFGALLLPGVVKCVEMLYGVYQVEPAVAIGEVSCPIFIIGGAEDPYMRPEELEDLYRSANTEKKIWIVANAAHDDFLEIAPFEYSKRVIGFLERTQCERNSVL